MATQVLGQIKEDSSVKRPRLGERKPAIAGQENIDSNVQPLNNMEQKIWQLRLMGTKKKKKEVKLKKHYGSKSAREVK